MSPLRILAALVAAVFLLVLPVAGHFLTRNDVERELETALVDYQTLPRDKFRPRLDAIAKGSGLDPSTVRIRIDESHPDAISVTIRYVSRMRLKLLPFTREVVVTKTTRKLGL